MNTEIKSDLVIISIIQFGYLTIHLDNKIPKIQYKKCIAVS